MKLELEINVDESTIDRRQLEARVRKEVILALFADRKMPAGQAARELGLQRLEFMELLRERGIPYVIYTAEDLDQDLATLDRLAPQIEENLRSRSE